METYEFQIGDVKLVAEIPEGLAGSVSFDLAVHPQTEDDVDRVLEAIGGAGRLEEVDGSYSGSVHARQGDFPRQFELTIYEPAEKRAPQPSIPAWMARLRDAQRAENEQVSA